MSVVGLYFAIPSAYRLKFLLQYKVFHDQKGNDESLLFLQFIKNTEGKRPFTQNYLNSPGFTFKVSCFDVFT